MQIVPPGPRLGLAPHVRACASDGQVILLDLRHNRYLGIDGTRAAALAGRVDGWPPHLLTEGGEDAPAAIDRLAADLVSRGLLTHGDQRQPKRPTFDEASESLDADPDTPGAEVGGRRIAQFCRSAVVASFWLRCRSLQAIAAAVQARRDRHDQKLAGTGSTAAASAGTVAYERLRPFALTAHERCLHDSLTLLGFLASEGVYPRWVIGVKTRPFGAHSWVQMNGTVLNDQHETVRQFRPILVA